MRIPRRRDAGSGGLEGASSVGLPCVHDPRFQVVDPAKRVRPKLPTAIVRWLSGDARPVRRRHSRHETFPPADGAWWHHLRPVMLVC